VHTVQGLKAIEDIRAGDYVYARAENGNDETVHRRQVLETYRFEDKATLTLTFTTPSGRYSVTTTDLHPFYVQGQGWTSAQDLTEGDAIPLKDGGSARVDSLEPQSGLTPVFNFAVDEDHTYFIGEDGLWVHNECGPNARTMVERRGRYDPHKQLTDEEYGSLSVWQEVEVNGKRTTEFAYPDAGRALEGFITEFDAEWTPNYPVATTNDRSLIQAGPNSQGNMRYSEGYVSYLANIAADLYDFGPLTQTPLKPPPLYSRTAVASEGLTIRAGGGNEAMIALIPGGGGNTGVRAMIVASTSQPLVSGGNISGQAYIGPTIGRGGYRSWASFATALEGVYSQAFSSAQTQWNSLTPTEQRATSRELSGRNLYGSAGGPCYPSVDCEPRPYRRPRPTDYG
jgi:hypothetical protein